MFKLEQLYLQKLILKVVNNLNVLDTTIVACSVLCEAMSMPALQDTVYSSINSKEIISV